MKIRYDVPIEVSKTQYDYLRVAMTGRIAHREEDGKYYIKVWHMEVANLIADYLKRTT